MFPLSVILFSLFLQQGSGENTSTESTSTPVIGAGVEAKIIVMYDTDAYKKNYTAHDPRKNNVMWYFLGAFDEVQRRFHNQKVMVTLSVVTVQKNETIWAKKNGSRDVNGTLQELQTVDKDYYPRPNETTAFLFTGDALPDRKESGIATLGTICNDNRSTAIVVLPPGSKNYTPIVEAMAHVFGANGTANFTAEDIQQMNHTFSNCYIKPSKKNKSRGKKNNPNDEYRHEPYITAGLITN
uniref:28 kDa Metastriate family member n=1 Tax=Rhipicephalus appendiculatus TaxID=34631 RepID=A0A131YUQ3_RHIAP